MSTDSPLPVKVTYRFPPTPGVDCDADGKEFLAKGDTAIPAVGDTVTFTMMRSKGIRGRYPDKLYQGERFTVAEVERHIFFSHSSVIRVDVTVYLEPSEG